MFPRALSCLLLCCFGLLPSSFLTATETSPYSLYLKLKHQFLQQDRLQKTEDWVPLFQQTFLSISTLQELSVRWIKEEGWTSTRNLLTHQLIDTNPKLEATQKWIHFLQQQHAPSGSGAPSESSELVHSTVPDLGDPFQEPPHLNPVLLLSDETSKSRSFSPPNSSLNDVLEPFLRFQRNHRLGITKTRENSLSELRNYAHAILHHPPKDFSPSHPSFYYLIDFAVLTAQLPLALEQIQFLLRSWPNDLGLLQRLYRSQVAELEIEEAKATFGKMIQHEGLTRDWIIAHANFLKEQRDYGTAVQVMHEALRRQSSPFWVYEQLLNLYPLSQPQPETWNQFALRCARLFPQEAVALYHSGLTSYYKGDTQTAIRHLNGCSEIGSFQHPELLNLPFYHALGSAYLREQRWEEALINFKQALLVMKSDSSDLTPECYHGISLSLMALAPENPLIEEFCRKAIQADEKEVRYYLTLVDWQIQQKEFTLAKETLGKATGLPALTEKERESIKQREKAIP